MILVNELEPTTWIIV